MDKPDDNDLTHQAQKMLRFFLAGDVMTGRGIDQAFPHSVNPVLYETYVKDARYYLKLAQGASGTIPKPISYDYLWGDALKILEQEAPGLRIINLETAVTTHEEYWKHKGINYRMHPKNAAFLKPAGIQLCVLANNHTLDWGHKGLLETLKVLKDSGIQTAGAGENAQQAQKPAIVATGSGRLLVFSYATLDAGVPRSWKAKKNRPGINLLDNINNARIQELVDYLLSARKRDDVVVFSIHWGHNWGYEIPAAHKKLAHALVESGAADIIHGHSSHHFKGIEVVNNRLILYGCGDLINDYEGVSSYPEYRGNLSLMYFPQLNAKGELSALKMVPVKMKRFRLHRVSGEEQDFIYELLNRECQKLGSSISIDNGNALILNRH